MDDKPSTDHDPELLPVEVEEFLTPDEAEADDTIDLHEQEESPLRDKK